MIIVFYGVINYHFFHSACFKQNDNLLKRGYYYKEVSLLDYKNDEPPIISDDKRPLDEHLESVAPDEDIHGKF